MKPKAHKVIEMCIEEGVAYGYMRAHKHNDQPPQVEIEAAIVASVMSEIYEWFDMEVGEE